MPDRNYATSVSTPASTTAAAPQVTAWVLEPETLVGITILVPNGHAGQTGIALRYAGERFLPWQGTQWIIANDESIPFELDMAIPNGRIEVVTYNVDAIAHSHYLRAHVRNRTGDVAVPIAPVEVVSF